MERTFSTDAAAELLDVKPSRLRECDANGIVTTQRLPNNVRVWCERDLAIAAHYFTAIDKGAPPYAARMLAQRLAGLKSAEEVAEYAARIALVERDGVWKLADDHLDQRATQLAWMAKRAGARAVFFNKGVKNAPERTAKSRTTHEKVSRGPDQSA